MDNILTANFSRENLGCRDGAVVRAPVSHQCGPGSIPRSGVICWLSLLVLYSAPRSFFPGTPVSPLLKNQQIDLIVLRVNVRKNQTTFEMRGKPWKIEFAHTFRFRRVMCPMKQDKVSLGFYRFILEKNANYRTQTKMPLGQAICLFILTVFSGQLKHPS